MIHCQQPSTLRGDLSSNVTGAVCTSQSGFKRHKCKSSKNNSNSGNILLKCDICEKIVNTVQGLKIHKTLKRKDSSGSNIKPDQNNSKLDETKKNNKTLESSLVPVVDNGVRRSTRKVK